MTEILILRVPAHEDALASWLVVDSNGAAVGGPQRGPLALAAPIAASKRVVVLVPGVDVLLAYPELPVKSGSHLAQVVPFALEEQIAGDVDGMHFAVGRRDAATGRTPVAAIARDKFEEWLQQLRGAGIEPNAVHADTSTVPALPGQTVLVVDADRVHVRTPGEPPFVLNAQSIAEALELADLGESGADRHAVAYLTQDDWQRHQACFDALRDKIAGLRVQLLPEGALPLFAREIVTQTPVDLLQGPYARKTRAGETWSQWRVAAFLLAGLVVLNLAGKAVEIWRLDSQERRLDAAIAQVFQEAMPGQGNAIDARRRMEARLAQIRDAGGEDRLLEVLAAVGNAFTQVPGTSVEAMSYRSDVLDLQIGARDVASLDRLEHLVEEKGLDVELQSSNARGDSIEGRMQVRARGPTPTPNRTAGLNASNAR